jgi:alkylresorcinol/alkylpyrone synthase
MPKIISAGTCDAPYRITQDEIKNFIHNLFSSYPDIDKMINVFDNSQIRKRHISVPIEWFKYRHSFKDRNEIFRETSLTLAKSAIENCLKPAGISASDIDCIIFVSSTGIITPTLDAILFNEIGLNSHIKRIPIWGLGCAGGASGISRAMDYTKAYPEQNCLMLAIELCSLTFQNDDISKSNIVASSLFSDGCAAVLVAGDKSKHSDDKCISLLDSLSTIYNDSLDVMGWDIIDDGFRVVFSRDIPSIVKNLVKLNIDELLSKNDLALPDIDYFVTHPGGVKVINAYKESLALEGETFRYSYKVLTEHGNMSSPSVLYVLKEFMDNNEFEQGKFGILSSLGPGFSSELVLFKT